MININMNNFMRAQVMNQRQCKSITHEVSISPPLWDRDAYSKWKEREDKISHDFREQERIKKENLEKDSTAIDNEDKK